MIFAHDTDLTVEMDDGTVYVIAATDIPSSGTDDENGQQLTNQFVDLGADTLIAKFMGESISIILNNGVV